MAAESPCERTHAHVRMYMHVGLGMMASSPPRPVGPGLRPDCVKAAVADHGPLPPLRGHKPV